MSIFQFSIVLAPSVLTSRRQKPIVISTIDINRWRMWRIQTTNAYQQLLNGCSWRWNRGVACILWFDIETIDKQWMAHYSHLVCAHSFQLTSINMICCCLPQYLPSFGDAVLLIAVFYRSKCSKHKIFDTIESWWNIRKNFEFMLFWMGFFNFEEVKP